MIYPLLIASAIAVACFCCQPAPVHAPAVVDVTDYLVEAKTIPAVFDFIGFAESIHPVEIRARVEGYLDQIAYREGSLVHQGDLLFQLDPKQYEAKVEQAKGEVLKQQALLANAKLTVQRLEPLYEQKAASKKDLDNAIAAQLSYEASLQSAKAQLLDTQINLGYTHITSPITGIADKSKFRQGALINPGSNSLLTTVSILDPIWVYFTISDNTILRTTQESLEKNIILLKENEYDVEAIYSDDSIYPYRGKVNFSAPSYDRSTGTLLARAVFPNPSAALLPGQFLRLRVYGAQRPHTLLVPKRALMQKNTGMFVYLIDGENKVVSQDVSTGDWYEEYQIVTNGLKAGDRLLVDGINKVRPGSVVNVIGRWAPEK